MSDSSEPSAFAEERRILLNRIAEQLASVLGRMQRINASLEVVLENDEHVQQVAEAWKAATREDETPNETAAKDDKMDDS